MRFRLRTLLMVMGVAPPLLAVVWWLNLAILVAAIALWAILALALLAIPWPVRPPRWLVVLIAATAIAVLLPLLGLAFPQLDTLRGFLYTWVFLLLAWILVGLYHLLKFISAMLERL
jgi:hypothetical protein